MKLAPIFAALVLGGVARADQPVTGISAGASPRSVAASPDAAFLSDTMRLDAHDRVTVNYPGATAVFVVDPLIADVSAKDGKITIVARDLGTTTISVITANGVWTFSLTVGSPQRSAAAFDSASLSRKWTVWQGGYESLSDRLTNSLELVDGSDHRTLRGYVVNVTRLDRSLPDSDTRSSLPALALEWRTRHNEVVVFDKLIEHSQLTLENVTVRGGHVRFEGVELHAGVTSPLLYQNVFLSTQREVVLGASYDLRVGRSTFTPSVYSYPSDPVTGGSKGTMGSLLYRYVTHDERLRLRSEVGWGGKFGAAGELTYVDGPQRVWAAARHEPRGFAALGIGRPIGSTFDGMWSDELTSRLSIDTTASAARYEVANYHQDTETGTANARYRLDHEISVSGGATVARFGGSGMAQSARSLTVPVGLYYDSAWIGGAAIHRYQVNSARNHGGHGGRLSGRLNLGEFHASAYVDAQQDAATVELILRNEPALAQLLNEMGLTADSPAELARLLRENAELAALGYSLGANLEFHPWRAQGGVDLAWLSRDRSRQQLHLRGLIDHTQEVNGKRETRTASLSYARRLGDAVDATAMLSWWSRSPAMPGGDTWSIAAGLRVRIDDVPRLPTFRRSDIDGVVVNDAEHEEPVAGVKVRLDGGRTAVTDAAGHFVFADARDGEHHVDAEVPDTFYFTGPSRIAITAGGSARFTVARVSARVTGYVRDDQGAGIAGVTVVLRGGARGDHTASTDSSGRFRFAVSKGDYVLEPVRETLPPGYDVSGVAPQQLQLTEGEPSELQLVIPANRSVAGTVHDAAATTGAASVRIIEIDRVAPLDDTGHYVFRGLAPGHYTIEATVGGKTMTHEVDVPATPTAVRDIDFP